VIRKIFEHLKLWKRLKDVGRRQG